MNPKRVLSFLTAAAMALTSVSAVDMSAFAEAADVSENSSSRVVDFGGNVQKLSVYSTDNGLEASTIYFDDTFVPTTIGELSNQYDGFSAGEITVSDCTIPGVTAQDITPYVFVQYGDNYTWQEPNSSVLTFDQLRELDSTITDDTVVKKLGLHMYITDSSLLTNGGAVAGKNEYLNTNGKEVICKRYGKNAQYTMYVQEESEDKLVAQLPIDISPADIIINKSTVAELKAKYCAVAVDEFSVTEDTGRISSDLFYKQLSVIISKEDYSDYHWYGNGNGIVSLSEIPDEYDGYTVRAITSDIHLTDASGYSVGDRIDVTLSGSGTTSDSGSETEPSEYADYIQLEMKDEPLAAGAKYNSGEDVKGFFFFDVPSANPGSDIQLYRFARQYGGFSIENFELTSASLPQIPLENAEYKIFIQYGKDETDWQWAEFEVTDKKLDIDEVYAKIPDTYLLREWGAVVSIPYDENDGAGIEYGDICIFNGTSDGNITVDGGSDMTYMRVREDASGNKYAAAYENITDSFPGIIAGVTTVGQFNKAYTAAYNKTVASCNIEGVTAGDFTIGVAFKVSAPGEPEAYKYIDDADSDTVIYGVAGMIAANDSVFTTGSLDVGNQIVINDSLNKEVFEYVYDGKPINLHVVQDDYGYNDMNCRSDDIDILAMMNEKYAISTVGDLRDHYSYVDFTDFFVNSIGGAAPADTDRSNVHWSISMMTNNWSNWYGWGDDTAFDITKLTAADDETINYLVLIVTLNNRNAKLSLGDAVILNPDSRTIANVTAGFTTVTASFESYEDYLIMDIANANLQIPNVTYGKTTVGELMDMYSEINVSDFIVTDISDSRFSRYWLSPSLVIDVVGTADGEQYSGNISHNGSNRLPLDSGMNMYNGSEQVEIDRDAVIMNLRVELFCGSTQPAMVGFKAGDKVTFAFNNASIKADTSDKASWDAGLKLSGTTLSWNAFPDQEQYSLYGLAVYGVYFGDQMLHSCWNGISDTYSVDLVNAFGTWNFEYGKQADIRVCLMDFNEWGKVISTSSDSIPYTYKMGRVLSSISKPVVKSATEYVNNFGLDISVGDSPYFVVKAREYDKNEYINFYFCDAGQTAYISTKLLSSNTLEIYSIDSEGNRSESIEYTISLAPDWDPEISIDSNGNLNFTKLADDSGSISYKVFYNDNWQNTIGNDYNMSSEVNVILDLTKLSFFDVSYGSSISVSLVAYDKDGNAIANGRNHEVVITYNGRDVSYTLPAPEVTLTRTSDNIHMSYLTWEPVDGAIGYIVKSSFNGEIRCWGQIGTYFQINTYFIDDLSNAEVFSVDKDGKISECADITVKNMPTWKANIKVSESGEYSFDQINGQDNVIYYITIGDFGNYGGAGLSSFNLNVYMAAMQYILKNDYGSKTKLSMYAVDSERRQVIAESSDTLDYSFRGGNTSNISSVSGVTISKTSDDLYKISWNPVDGAVGYFTPIWETSFYWTLEPEIYIHKNYIDSIGTLHIISVDKDGNISKPTDYTIDLTKPIISVEAGEGQATVSWNEVPGATQYVVFTYYDGVYTAVAYPTGTSYTVTGLIGGEEYGFLVRAKVGGKWTSFSDSDVRYATIKTTSKPSFTVMPGAGQAVVSWNEVPGATQYVVFTYYDGVYTPVAYTTDTIYTVTGLNGGVEYGFLVRAKINDKWTSFTSEDVKYATIKAASKPIISVMPGEGQAVVSWNEVAGATQYVVFTYYDGVYTAVAYPTETSYTVTGLIGGEEYGFLVRAKVNNKWTSFTNSDVKYATIKAATKPTVTVLPGAGQADLTWNEVDGATQYVVFTYYDGTYTAVAYPTETSYTVTGLKGGEKYGFLVRAKVNNKWTSFTSADVKYATIKAAAKPVISVMPGEGQAVVSWNEVAGATQYVVFTYYDGVYTAVAYPTETSYTVTGLNGGEEYGFLVRAKVNNKWTSFTNSDVKYATIKAATKPTVTVLPGAGQADLTWNEVDGATQYVVFTYYDGVYTAVAYINDTTYTITGLVGGEEYGFLVRAKVNNKWTSFTSADVKYATIKAAAKPVISVMPGEGQAELNWNEVDGATQYVVFTYYDGVYTAVDYITDTSYTVTGLKGGEKYGFLVRAKVNNKWTSFTNADVKYATIKAATKPTVTVLPGEGQAELSWNEVAGATQYVVFTYYDGIYTPVDYITDTSYTVTDLESGEEYGFLVRAKVNNKWTSFTSADVKYATIR